MNNNNNTILNLFGSWIPVNLLITLFCFACVPCMDSSYVE